MYKLYHYPFDQNYFFRKKPGIRDMINILNKLGYKMNGSKILSDDIGIKCEHTARAEFRISKIKFED